MRENAVQIISETVKRWKPEAKLQSIQALTPDASLRRYFRLTVSTEFEPLVAMLFDSVASPEASGAKQLPSDRSYVELSRFLSENEISVPELLFDDEANQVLLIEDLGSELLADVLLSADSAKSAEVGGLYRQAVEQIVLLQSIPPEPNFFPFERSFSAELYRREMSEFEQYVLQPQGASPRTMELSAERFSELARELAALPQVLVHRDFHSWNLMVDQSRRLRVIDFQDALMATRAYDLVGLLNDRDTDAALGLARYRRLLSYFHEQTGWRADFFEEYDKVLLQRDLKVAGRFNKLSTERGLTNYEKWVPGTLKRIGSTLARMAAYDGRYSALRDALAQSIPQIALGAENPVVLK